MVDTFYPPVIEKGRNSHMANRHVKVINGKKYYYESIRKGKKVTSKYLGPVEPKKLRAEDKQPELEIKEEEKEDIMPDGEESYIG